MTGPGNNNSRRARVQHALRDVLTDLIANEVRDPRVRAATLLTIAKVEMNVDMAVANVYVSIIGDDATVDGVIEGLNKAAGFLRGPVGRELSLQRAPELRFHHDITIDVGAKLRAIVLEDQARARAAGRDPEAEAAGSGAPSGDKTVVSGGTTEAKHAPSDGEKEPG